MKGKALALSLGLVAALSGRLCAGEAPPDDLRDLVLTQYGGIDRMLKQGSQLAADWEKAVDTAVEAWKAAGAAPSATPTPQPGTFEVPVVQVEAEKRYAQECRSSFSVNNAVANAVRDGVVDKDGVIRGVFGNLLYRTYECRAYAERNPGLCKTPKTFRWSWPTGVLDLEKPCTFRAIEMLLAQATISGRPDAVKVCEEFDEKRPGDAHLKADWTEFCRLQVRERDPRTACEKIRQLTKKYGEEDEDDVDCLRRHRLRHGDASLCSSLANAYDKEFCVGFAAYKEALAAKSSAPCGKSAVCRLMMGEAKVCDELAADVAAEYCRLSALQKVEARKPAFAMEQKSLIDRLGQEQQRKVQADLAKAMEASQRHGTRKAAIMDGIRLRRSQFEALYVQLDAALESIEPKGVPPFRERREQQKALRRRFEQGLRRFKTATRQ